MKTKESFDSLVNKLEKKGYSKDYATKVAGKVAKEKGDIGKHHESRDDRVAECRKLVDCLMRRK